jgi:RND family efflux transporter MFP subunit
MAASIANFRQQLHKMVGWSPAAHLCDGELVERFVVRRDEAAFEELMARHGPMVLNVCRHFLRDPNDADDAFQATFLVLVRRAASIGMRDRLANWLYGVAYRVAFRSRAQITRRQTHEKQGLAVEGTEPCRREPQEDLLPLVHAEVDRLPERYRAVIVLCCLEGQSQEHAAQYLGCTPGAVKGRLERGREVLRKRLVRRGIVLSAAATGTIFPAHVEAVPPALAASTGKAASLIGQATAADVISAQVIALMEGVLKTMLITKLKMAAVLLLVVCALGAGVAAFGYRALAAAPADGNVADNPRSAIIPADEPPVASIAQEHKSKHKDQPAPAGVRKVQVMRPISRKEIEYRNFATRIGAPIAEVRSEVSGTLAKVLVLDGAAVKKGDVLFELDPRQLEGELLKTEAEVARAEARSKSVDAQLARAKKLLEAKTLSSEEFQQTSLERDDAALAMHSARASRDIAQLHLNSTKVKAPISGKAGRVHLTVGTVITAGATVLTTIVGTDRMSMQFYVDEATFLRLQRAVQAGAIQLLGGEVDFRFADETKFARKATIDFVDNQIDRTNGLLVRASLPQSDHFSMPGMSLFGRFPVSAPRPVILLPYNAFPSESYQHTEGLMYVVNNRNVVEQRQVTFGWLTDDGFRVVEDGLTADDWVIVHRQNDVRPGLVVEPEKVSAPPAGRK